MMVWMWALALAADPGPTVEPLAVPPEADALRRALSMRHPVPCEVLEADLAAPVDALRWAVSEVQQPPWAAMHAAECLTRNHPEAAKADLLRWVTEPGLIGLGRQTLGLLDAVPEAVAIEVARAALVGPVADKALETVQTDPRPAVRALEVAP